MKPIGAVDVNWLRLDAIAAGVVTAAVARHIVPPQAAII
jgi:hypothetical protein